MFQFLSLKKNIDSLIASLAGFLIIFLFTRHGGIGVCPDGVVYTTTADNLYHNGTLTDFTHNPLIVFPAFYPLLLDCLMWLTGLKPLLFAPVLNALLFSFIIYLSGCIMEQFAHRSKLYKAALLSCIVLSPALLEVYSMVWSETIFILLLLLFIMAIRRYLNSYSLKWLLAAALLTAVASVTRYAGITIIATGGLLILFDLKLLLRKKMLDFLLYISVSSTLLIINLARNYIVSGTGTGHREKATATLHENIHDTGAVLNDWLPFLHNHYAGAAWVAVFLIAFLLFSCVKQHKHNGRWSTFEDIALIFSLLYILFMIVIASISRFETLNSRFFSPVFIPLIWSCSSWLAYGNQKRNFSKKKWLIAVGLLIFLCFQYGQLAADYETWDGVKDAGIPGYTEDQWRYSETVQFIKKDSLLYRKNYTIYSNAYDAVYFFTRSPGKFLPHKEYRPGIQKFLGDPHCYVVWFDDGEDPDLVTMNFITHVKKMKLLKQFNDGAVYEYDK